MEIIGFLIAAFVAWKAFFWILSIVFPRYGLRRAMARHHDHPTESNLQAVMRAQEWLSKRMGH
jgi:hypothetical protein